MVVDIEMRTHNAIRSPLFHIYTWKYQPISTRSSHPTQTRGNTAAPAHCRLARAAARWLPLHTAAWPGPPREVLPRARKPTGLPLRMARAATSPTGRDGAWRGHGLRRGKLPRSCSWANLFCVEGGGELEAGSAARNGGRSSLTRGHVLKPEAEGLRGRSGMAARVPPSCRVRSDTRRVAWGSWRLGMRRTAVVIQVRSSCGGTWETGNLAGGLHALEGSRWRGRASRFEDGTHVYMRGRRRAWSAGAARVA
jgi:hypothetical protein